MRKSILFSTTAFLLLTVYSSFMETASYAGGNRKTITGQVTLVGDRILKIKEDGTQLEYLLESEPEKLVDYNHGVQRGGGDIWRDCFIHIYIGHANESRARAFSEMGCDNRAVSLTLSF